MAERVMTKLRPRGRLLFACVLVAGAVSIVAALAAARPIATPLTVNVDARDFSFALSRRSVPKPGTIRFVVRNRGASPHNFVIAGKRTRILEPGKSEVLTVRLGKVGLISFACSLPGHAKLGMEGRFAVGRPAPPVKPLPAPVDLKGTVRLTSIGTFERPVEVVAPPGDTHRVFVVEQAGRIRLLRDGVLANAPFLDIADQVLMTNEPGLLGLAFPPDWATSRRFTVIYNQHKANGDLRLADFLTAAVNPDIADLGSSRTLLEIVKPWENHNGGMLQYDADGLLYISVGDGDSGYLNPPGAFGQTRDDLLGDILRIDPSHGSPYSIPPGNPFVGIPGVRPEIWAYGLRNPWRFWLDPPTGAMFIGDVGFGQREEVDLIPKGTSGLDFGWPCFEGKVPYDAKATCPNAVAPILQYDHDHGGCSVIGGVVARDPRLPLLNGRYLYGDYCFGHIFAARILGGRVVKTDDLGVEVPGLSSFGVDGLGRVYATTISGPVYRLDPPS
jgi:glucose/arabinose dehydrogenase